MKRVVTRPKDETDRNKIQNPESRPEIKRNCEHKQREPAVQQREPAFIREDVSHHRDENHILEHATTVHAVVAAPGGPPGAKTRVRNHHHKPQIEKIWGNQQYHNLSKEC